MPYSIGYNFLNTFLDTTHLIAGNYIVLVSDSNNCAVNGDTISNILTYTITQPTLLEIDSITKTDIACASVSNGTATAYASGGVLGYTYLWMPGGQTTQTATNLSSGTYVCTITDDNGC